MCLSMRREISKLRCDCPRQSVTKISGIFLYERSEPLVKARDGFHRSGTMKCSESLFSDENISANCKIGGVILRVIHGPAPSGLRYYVWVGTDCSRQSVTKISGIFLHERSEPLVKARDGFHSSGTMIDSESHSSDK